jgi:hypothetical protein
MSVFSLAAMRTALRVIVVFSTPPKNMQSPRHSHANARRKHMQIRAIMNMKLYASTLKARQNSPLPLLP